MMGERRPRDDVEPPMAWLSLLLFLPWFVLLGALFCVYPRQRGLSRRRWFDPIALASALLLSVLAMHWGYRVAAAETGARVGPIWPQVVAVLYAYGTFLAALLLALWVRPRWVGAARDGGPLRPKADRSLRGGTPGMAVPHAPGPGMTSLDPSIHIIDTGFQRTAFDAAYLVVEEGQGAFIDCGTGLAVPAMLRALQDAGLRPADVRWVLLTHVHLDHAGGAGALMRHLPAARLVVHPRGAPHMIDPTRLIASATAVYGAEEIARSHGVIEAVPAERIVLAEDGFVASLAGRTLECMHTPGHALHHYCVWDARSASWFTGDTFGLSYRELDSARGAFILPTSSPLQFEPEPLKDSILRMLARSPRAMYITHYGALQEVQRLGDDLLRQIDAMAVIARQCDGRPDRHRCLVAALRTLYLERARAHGCPLDDAGVQAVLAMDIELNAQGLACWLDRARR